MVQTRGSPGHLQTNQMAAPNAIKRPSNSEQEPPTINYQRQQAKAEALRKWEERWHAGPRTFLAYRTACTKPPDGKLHHIHHPDDEDGTRTFQGHKLPLATLLQRKCRESKRSLIIVFQ
jgi:hypothetical protein